MADIKNESDDSAVKVTMLPVKSISPAASNMRAGESSERGLADLATSIDKNGLLHPITVRPLANARKTSYEIVAGERRWRAFLLRGWKRIPAVVRLLSDEEAYGIMAVENLQRESLTPFEESDSIRVLFSAGMSMSAIADMLGRSMSWVARRSRLALLSKKWRVALADPYNGLSKWSVLHLDLVARYDTEEQNKILEEYSNWFDCANVTLKGLETHLAERSFAVSRAPWRKVDAELFPDTGACRECVKRTGCQTELFEPITKVKKAATDRCLDTDCWNRKLAVYHDTQLRKAREKHDGLVLLDNDCRESALPAEYREQALASYAVTKAEKDDPGAVPAYVVGGPGAGKVEYVKVESWAKNTKKARATDGSGKALPKSIEERRAGLHRKRELLLLRKMTLIFQGKDSKTTSCKPGVCRVCGCTGNDCSGCIEKTGAPCWWINAEKTLCSACSDRATEEGRNKRRMLDLAGIVTHEVALKLVAAFGASRAPAEIILPEVEGAEGLPAALVHQMQIFSSLIEMNDTLNVSDLAVVGVFDKIIDKINSTVMAKGDLDMGHWRDACEVFNIPYDLLWEESVSELPEPKSWSPCAEKNGVK